MGAIAAAGANHVADHDLLVKCISKYLHIDEVPRIGQCETFQARFSQACISRGSGAVKRIAFSVIGWVNSRAKE